MDGVSNVQAMDMGMLARKIRQITNRPAVRDPLGEPEGIISHPNQFDDSYHADYIIICKDIADKLFKRYPGWLWAVQPVSAGRIINIYCLQLHDQWGYTIRMVDIMDDPARKEAYRAGHEILRRFNMPDRFSRDRVEEAPRDAHGRCIPDISDIGTAKQKQDAQIAHDLATGVAEIVEVEGHRYLRRKG